MPLPSDEEIAKSSFSHRLKALLPTTLLPMLVATMLGAVSAIVANYISAGDHRPRTIEIYEGNLVAAQSNIGLALRFATLVRSDSATNANSTPAEFATQMDEITNALLRAKAAIEAARVPDYAKPNFIQRTGDYFLNLIFPAARAQDATKAARETSPIEYMRQGVAAFMLTAISVLLFVFLYIYFKTEDPEKIKFSQSMIQMIVGFYIGVVTAVLGIPA